MRMSLNFMRETYDLFSPGEEQESEYCELRYIKQRNKEELLHENWIKQRRDLEKEFQEKIGNSIKVRSADNYVKFIYKYKGHEIFDATIFRFKIIIVYHNLLRKWYISPGYSFVPEVIDLKDKLKSGTNHPFSEKVFNLIDDVIHLIDIFMTRLTTVYQLMYNVQKKYKDLQFAMNAIVTEIILTFTENAWPTDIHKFTIKDMIILKLKLEKNIQDIHTIAYTYKYQKVQAKDGREHLNRFLKRNINKLQSKLQTFFHFSLEEAIERFITWSETSTSSQEHEGSQ
ncbi:uncharacterized protein LOC105834186 [Monomorium pharaonis]|uniref:uncharacterized protein LOC105834186 n=1 Tax=Monomorium pharaonis TaxID=307658 RepID=UPI00063F384D|nr:uncharacterized protein LOC105834186 [Monomorium pharaonis]